LPGKAVRNCIFCLIVKGELSSVNLYEDDLVLAFFDINPINLGHALIIPREHHTSLTTVPPHILARMMAVAPRIGQAVMRETSSAAFNLHLANGEVAGQTVPHTHLHVIPRQPTDGHSWGWRSLAYPSRKAMVQMGERIRRRLETEDPSTEASNMDTQETGE